MPDHADWLWVRLERPSTDSVMTVCLGPFELDGRMVDRLVNRGWPGWEVIQHGMGCCEEPVPELLPDWPGDSTEL